MAGLTDAEIDAAMERGRIAQQTEPRASSARYDPEARRIIVELTSGCTFSFPPEIAQGLQGATDDELAAVEILGAGYGLHWEALDADLSVPGLLAGRFGTKAHMTLLADQATPKNLIEALSKVKPLGKEDQFPDEDGASERNPQD